MLKKSILALTAVLFLGVAASFAEASILVGRLAQVEGEVLRYIESSDEWSAQETENPVGPGDLFQTGDPGKAEFVFPNGTLLRIGENTDMDVVALEEDLTEVTLTGGIARATNTGGESLRVSFAAGYCLVPKGAEADVRVADGRVEVTALSGATTVYRPRADGTEERYPVAAGASLVIDGERIASGSGRPDPLWDRWCRERESVRGRYRERSPYLPDTLQEHAWLMQENGRWENIYYRGRNYWFWQPLAVAVDWAPFTVGYWGEWYGDHVWVSAEPWGWVTHHYGHWVRIRGAWWWTPYIYIGHSEPGISFVGLSIRFGPAFRPHWHPGRVVWLSSPTYVGWVPLSPWEHDYCRFNWGPQTIVVNDSSLFSVRLTLANYRYLDHAVVVGHRHFYRPYYARRSGYAPVRVESIARNAILSTFKPAPVFNARVINNFQLVNVDEKYHFVPKTKTRRPPERWQREKRLRRQVEDRRQERRRVESAPAAPRERIDRGRPQRERTRPEATPGGRTDRPQPRPRVGGPQPDPPAPKGALPERRRDLERQAPGDDAPESRRNRDRRRELEQRRRGEPDERRPVVEEPPESRRNRDRRRDVEQQRQNRGGLGDRTPGPREVPSPPPSRPSQPGRIEPPATRQQPSAPVLKAPPEDSDNASDRGLRPPPGVRSRQAGREPLSDDVLQENPPERTRGRQRRGIP